MDMRWRKLQLAPCFANDELLQCLRYLIVEFVQMWFHSSELKVPVEFLVNLDGLLNGNINDGGANSVLARVHVQPGTIDIDQSGGQQIPIIFPRIDVGEHSKVFSKVGCNNDDAPPTTAAE